MLSVRSLLLLIAIALVPGAHARAQRIDLTAMSPEERWDRASMHVTLFTAMYVRDALKSGKTPGDAGRELANFFGPWPAVATPADMARTIYRNWQLWRTMDYVADQAPDGSVTVTTSRPYKAALDRYPNIGVDATAFDAMFGAFHKAIAEKQGLAFQISVDSVIVRMFINRRP